MAFRAVSARKAHVLRDAFRVCAVLERIAGVVYYANAIGGEFHPALGTAHLFTHQAARLASTSASNFAPTAESFATSLLSVVSKPRTSTGIIWQLGVSPIAI